MTNNKLIEAMDTAIEEHLALLTQYTQSDVDDFRNEVFATIEAAGFVVVPREPTDEMIDELYRETRFPIDAPELYRMYQAAITASQQETDSQCE